MLDSIRDAPKIPEDAPKIPEDAPKIPEDAPKISEDARNCAKFYRILRRSRANHGVGRFVRN